MKVSLNWLKEHVDIELSPEDLCHLLTMAGLEVEGLEGVGQNLDDILVARILEVSPHPNADRLSLCRVDAGAEIITVVCGAPNVTEGVLAPLILPGGKLPDGTRMKESRIRGEVSKGMLLAEDEMGLTDDHAGIMILPEGATPGTPLATVLSFPDWIFDVSITPNRPDCASVLGIAREISANTGKPLKYFEQAFDANGPAIGELTNVTIRDPEGCPRYAAAVVQDVSLKPTPFWMRYRLFQSGVRSISNLVDISNYVMLEMGQPLHAFDYDKLSENRIEVRRAKKDETFTTLDGVKRDLDPETLLICDGQKPVALAGIMGGLNSEIHDETKNILVESAFFDPITIRRGSKRLGLSTEASYRFERGADVGGVIAALNRALYFINLLAGGITAKGIVDNNSIPFTAPRISFRPEKTNAILGTHISTHAMKGYFEALEMEVLEDQKRLYVSPPTFRVDIKREVDLVEEVARLHGFDNIPVISPRITPSDVPESPDLLLRDQARALMMAFGFSEIITYSFVSPDSVNAFSGETSGPLNAFTRIMNPLTVDQSVLRTSLIPGLMETARYNVLHEMGDLKLFEWGKVFFDRENEAQPLEKIYLAGVMVGMHAEKSWHNEERVVDFYDMKGVLTALLKGMGLKGIHFKQEKDLPGYDSEISTGIYDADTRLGQMGFVAPEVMDVYELKINPVCLFEMDVGALLTALPLKKTFLPFGKFPPVHRDLSLVLDRGIECAVITDIIREEGGHLLESVQVFDLYEGERIDASKKAISFKISFRSDRGTLDGEEINVLYQAIVEKIGQKTGGKLREG
ncbi:MAG: phenylalanine--tRNA ligase subunit beta [Desulfobacteraceae bacterium 4572_87]|nr:MAG: phenylalanine--tRNA ligase subunit beta [Desulfobacteraceae bacterium 4572_87]